MFSFESKGSFNKTDSFLRNASKLNMRPILEACGREGVKALSSATPIDSKLTANSWGFKISSSRSSSSITWTNDNVVDGQPLAIMLQYGHGTGTGGYVEGRDYINPAMKPVFDRIANRVWKAVTSA